MQMDEATHPLVHLARRDGRPVHTHRYQGVASFDVGHRHRYTGVTAPAPGGVQHTHVYEAKTTSDDGHTHIIRGRTGPAIPLPGGGHYHVMAGATTVGGVTPHRHSYAGRTGDAESPPTG